MIIRRSTIFRQAAAGMIALAANSPFALQVTHGPFLVDQTETATTIMWFTDVNCYGSVEYGIGGSFANKEEEVVRGVLAVGTHHQVRLAGLTPGQTYDYRVVSTEVTSYLTYFPVAGSTITSAGSQFTALDRAKASFTFYVVNDIHNDVNRMNTLLNCATWTSADFIVLTGDILTDLNLSDSAQVFSVVVDPCVSRFAKSKEVVYVRGNHEYRGSLMPKVPSYFPNTSGEWYYTFSHGPAHFLIFDSGEDKTDGSTEYGGILRSEAYKLVEKAWWQNYVSSNASFLSRFNAKIALVHAPDWGYNTNWDSLANAAGVNLRISGHTHSYSHSTPGGGRNFHTLVVGQNQIARVTVSAAQIDVVVYNNTCGQVAAWNVSLPPVGVIDAQMTDVLPNTKTFGLFKVAGCRFIVPGEMAGKLKSIAVYDLTGRLRMKTITGDRAIQWVDNAGTTQGIYVVQVKTVR